MSRIKSRLPHKPHPFETNPSATEQELLDMLGALQRTTAVMYNKFVVNKREITSLKDRLRAIRNNREGSKMTEHALLRYVERVNGIDLGAIERQVVAMVPADKKFGDLPVTIEGQELVLILREGHIVTIREAKEYQEALNGNK